MKKLLLIPLLFLVGCGTQIPIKQPVISNQQEIQGEKQRRMAISQEQNLGGTQETETIDVEVKPQEVIPAEVVKMTKKEVKAKIDEINVDIQIQIDERDGAEARLLELRNEKEQYKLLLTQFK